MSATLADIVAYKKIEIERSKAVVSAESLRSQIQKADGRFRQALLKPGTHFICEIKPKSPSAGVLTQDLRLDDVVASFERHASAISVLTDAAFFGGGFDLLAQVRSKSALPILCKDFVLDSYQCFQARHHGADAVLLIVKILEGRQLHELHSQIVELGMSAVVEIQNESELERALEISPDIVLINNRNLDTFQIDMNTTKRLVPKLPAETIKIAASGVESRADIDLLLSLCSTFLIGSTLMKAADPETKLRELKGETCASPGETAVRFNREKQ